MCIVFFVVQVRTATPPGLYEQCKQETKALELSQVHFSADGKEIVVEVYSNVCIAHSFDFIIFELAKPMNWFFVISTGATVVVVIVKLSCRCGNHPKDS